MSTPRPRLRFAPSPTGYVHIGGGRTALYNYLLAKSMGGSFILRIEDTDRNRYVPGSEQDIMASLRALGIEWDEGPDIGGAYGPYRQSERLPIYHELLHQLIATGKAYPCFCSPERLEQVRKEQEAKKLPPGYDRHCRSIDPAEAQKRMQTEPYVIRFKMPLTGTTEVYDILRGALTFENSTQDDHVLLKRRLPGDEYAWPTYHGCSPIDDHLMGITHIVRGDEWLSSTPKHQQLFEAFGWDVPKFAHLPVILSPSGKGKMSKRDGTTGIREFLQQGYLPEALVNFILLMGWAGSGEREFYSMEEAAAEFSFEGMSKSPAAFNTDKLKWFNGMYIRRLTLEELAEKLVPFMQSAGLLTKAPSVEEMSTLCAIAGLVQERTTTLSEVPAQVDFLFTDTLEYDPALLITKNMTPDAVAGVLMHTIKVVQSAGDFTGEALHAQLQEMADQLGLKAGQVFMPLRVALSGRTVSPGSTTDIMAILGKERTLRRLELAQQKLAH